jgi:prefoldin subunit 5
MADQETVKLLKDEVENLKKCVSDMINELREKDAQIVQLESEVSYLKRQAPLPR